MNGKSKKNIETEKFVDSYTAKHGYPPTYEEVAKKFNIVHSVAWYRCKKFREKMKKQPDNRMIVRLKYEVPVSKFEKFSELLAQIQKLLTTPTGDKEERK